MLATFLSVLFCLLSLLISDSRFDLVWFRLSCDHGWIRSGSVNVRKITTNKQHLCKVVQNACLLQAFCVSVGAYATEPLRPRLDYVVQV